MATTVEITDKALKALSKAPKQVVNNVLRWVEGVEADGLAAMRKIPGFHDEPLKGRRKGQRSIRLNRSWRAIYVEAQDGEAHLVEVQEVSNHDY